MSFIALKCPGCGYRFMVSPHAPPTITCGNCLTSIATGNIDSIGPIPVIPLNRLAGMDRQLITWLLMLSGTMLVGGSALAIFAGNSAEWCIILAAVAVVVLIICAVLFIRQNLQRPPEVTREPTSWRGGTLSYRSPIQPRHTSAVPSFAIALGIVLLILLGIAFLILGTCAAIMTAALGGGQP